MSAPAVLEIARPDATLVRPEPDATSAWVAGRGLIARETEIAQVAEALAGSAIVTITGPGGVGKTSVARVVAAAAPPGQAVVECELGEVLTGEAVRPAVAASLGVQPLPGLPIGRTRLAVAEDPLLIVLDNCEHVLDTAAEVAADLTAAGSHVRVLATSREPLGLPGERVVPIRPLSTPTEVDDSGAAESPAVALFVRRAVGVNAGFRLDAETTRDVARICLTLDGLPLALELAAARTRSMSVRDIADRLDRPWLLLRSTARRVPERHSSLRAVFDWSWGLLTAPEQALLCGLAVHPGGADLAAAAAAIDAGDDETLDLLDSLVAKSLVSHQARQGRSRYKMPETLRAYGIARLEHLAALGAARDRHASHYVSLARETRRGGLKTWCPETFASFAADFDNVRAAVAWTLANDATPDRTFELLAPLWFVCQVQGEEEIVTLTDRALSRWATPDHPLWSEVAATAAEANAGVDQIEEAMRRARQAIDAHTSLVGVAYAWKLLAEMSAFVNDDCATATQQLSHAAEAARGLEYESLLNALSLVHAHVLGQSGGGEQVITAAEHALQRARHEGNPLIEAGSQHLLGVALATEDPEAARRWLSAARTGAEALGSPYLVWVADRGLATLTTATGELSAAAELFVDAVDGLGRIGCQVERWTTIAAVLPLLVRAGRQETAALLLEALEAAPVVVRRLEAPAFAMVRHEPEDRRCQGLRSARTRPSPLGLDQLFQLVRRELIEIARRSGQHRKERGEPDTPPPWPTRPAGREELGELIRRGDLWFVSYAGEEAHVSDLKGVHDLAALLIQPGRELAALDLISAGGPGGLGRRRTFARDEDLNVAGDLGEQLDATARSAYVARIRELQGDLDAADAAGDTERGARAQAELDFLTRELSAAYGLHGPRRVGDPAERARAAVTGRIRSAIARIHGVHPVLGRHLETSVRTGRFCSYIPGEPTTWTVRR